MFSPRLLTVLALVAAAAAWPASEKPQYPNPITDLDGPDFFGPSPWYSFLSNIFEPVLQSFGKFTHVNAFGPKVSEDDKKFQVEMKLDNYNKDDIKVKVKGCFLYIQGTHESKKDDQEIFSSSFFQTFSLPANASGNDVTARLDNKTLIVSVPKNGPADNENIDRVVPIEGTDIISDDKSSPSLETSTVPEDDRKEPTTPANSEHSDNDNSIPHGNDA